MKTYLHPEPAVHHESTGSATIARAEAFMPPLDLREPPPEIPVEQRRKYCARHSRSYALDGACMECVDVTDVFGFGDEGLV